MFVLSVDQCSVIFPFIRSLLLHVLWGDHCWCEPRVLSIPTLSSLITRFLFLFVTGLWRANIKHTEHLWKQRLVYKPHTTHCAIRPTKSVLSQQQLVLLAKIADWCNIATHIWVNIGSGNGSVPSGPMLTHRRRYLEALTWLEFDRNCSRYLYFICVKNTDSRLQPHISRDHGRVNCGSLLWLFWRTKTSLFRYSTV